MNYKTISANTFEERKRQRKQNKEAREKSKDDPNIRSYGKLKSILKNSSTVDLAKKGISPELL